MVEIENGEVKGATEVANPPHEEGGCLRPVGILADAGVDAIVAAGMGMRPLMGFNQVGITVYFDNEHAIVGDAARIVAAGQAPVMGADQACQPPSLRKSAKRQPPQTPRMTRSAGAPVLLVRCGAPHVIGAFGRAKLCAYHREGRGCAASSRTKRRVPFGGVGQGVQDHRPSA